MRRIMTFLSPFLILFCMIFGNELGGGTFSFYPVLKAEAAEYTTYVSDKDGVDGLVDYENGSVDYIIPQQKILLVEHKNGVSNVTGYVNDSLADVVFEKRVNGSWVIDDNPPFRYDTQYDGVEAKIVYDQENGEEWNDGLFISDRRIRIRFPDAALASDGTMHDVSMILSSFYFQSDDGTTPQDFKVMHQDGYGTLCFYASVSINNFVRGDGTSFDVDISVSGASASEKLFLMFIDIDQPGFDEEYSGSVSEYACIESIKIKSGIAAGTQPHVPDDHLLRIEDGSQPEYYATQDTSGADSYRSAVSYLARASGTRFQWSGHVCGTSIGVNLNDIPSFTVKTGVRVETDTSPATGTKTYGSWTTVDTMRYLKLMSVDYSCTYGKSDLLSDQSLSSSDDWIFNFTGQTVGGTGIKNDTTYEITVNRNRYTYSFNANPPYDRSASDVKNLPSDKTVTASKVESGKSDASVKSPTLFGYVFKGWNTKADGTGSAYPGAETMKSNKTFYAQWERASYTVHFDGNGSSNPDHQEGERTQNVVAGTMTSQKMQFDTPANLKTNTFTRAGYTFFGWNTKSDGTGTSYSDQQSVTNLIGYDKSELTLYAQWTKKFGTETITVISEETGNPVNGVSMKLQKNVNGTWTDVTTGITDGNGKITMNDLHWFDWRWVMTGVPAGYVKSADTAFFITYNQLSVENQVILYLKRVNITLDAHVSDIIRGEMAPAFLYRIEGTDAAGVNHTYHLLVQTNELSRFGSRHLTGLFAGTYTITQIPVSRYVPGSAVNVEHGTPDGINAVADVLHYEHAEIRFPYTIREYGWYYGVNSRINNLTE